MKMNHMSNFESKRRLSYRGNELASVLNNISDIVVATSNHKINKEFKFMIEKAVIIKEGK